MRNTRLIIDLNAIAANARALREFDSSIKMMAVVKANAYGHGDVDVARIALANGFDWLGVAIAEEGLRLRGAGIDAPILILGALDPEAVDGVVAHKLTQAVFTPEHIRLLDESAARMDSTADVHIKVETGMNRIGASGASLDALMDAADRAAHIRVTGAFTHLSVADSFTPDDDGYTRRQMDSFIRYAAILRERFGSDGRPFIAHAANSAGFLRWPDARLDMARVGIALYGAPPVPTKVELKQAMRWVSRVTNVKDVSASSTIGYGRTFAAGRDTRVATIPAGYADGYHRALSNRGFILVRGRRAPIIGRVCMDQFMADVTDIPGVSIGDEAVLLGNQGHDAITADELGEWAATISYEMFCSPSARAPREVIEVEQLQLNSFDRAAMRRLIVESTTAASRAADSQAIAKHLFASEAWRSAVCVFCYVSVDWEVSTSAIISAAISQGKMVCVPRTLDTLGNMEAVTYHGESGTSGIMDLSVAFGIPAPMSGDVVPPDAIDLAIVPGMAFDKQGARIGRGKGFYDRYLANCDAYRVGLAYDCQILDRIGINPWDQRMNAITAPDGLYETGL